MMSAPKKFVGSLNNSFQTKIQQKFLIDCDESSDHSFLSDWIGHKNLVALDEQAIRNEDVSVNYGDRITTNGQ